MIEEEVIVLEDIIAVSGTVGKDYAGDFTINPFAEE